MPQPTTAPQSYATHRRIAPLPATAALLLCANLGVCLSVLFRDQTWLNAWHVVLAVALVATVVSARRMAQTVQDRVIRLEMRLRLATLLGPSRAADIARLTTGQLIALRFAGDGELPSLVDRVLRGELPSGDAIKRAVTDWQPDHLRC